MAVRPHTDGRVTLRLTVITHVDARRQGQRLVVQHDGGERVEALHGRGPHTVDVDLSGGRTTWLTMTFPDRWSPGPVDPRPLAVGLVTAELMSAAQ